MPCYEYRCTANGRTLEVRHAMNERLDTWGEVAAAAGVDVGDTPSDAPVERLMSAAMVGASDAHGHAHEGSDAGFRGCGPGCACAHEA